MRPKTILRDLHAACLPFTTRLLRGARLRRHITIAVVIAVLTVVAGLWLALGTGDTARETRRGLGFEPGRQERAVIDMVVLGDNPYEATMLAEASARVRTGEPDGRPQWFDTRVESVARTAHMRALAAMHSAHGRASPELQRAVWEVIDQGIARGYPQETPLVWFDWNDEADRAWLERYVSVEGVPLATRYTSPLGVVGVARMIGILGAGVLLLLTMVVAPLWVGTVVAQEVSENTLQPLTATALTKRQLALGLLLGPLAVVGIHAGPIAVVVAVMGLVGGQVLAVLGFLVVIVIAMLALSVMAQMFALSVGRTRAPGTVGVLLSAVLGAALLAGIGLAIDAPRDAVGLMTSLPESAAVHLLRAAFVPHTAGIDGVMPLRVDLGIAIGGAGLLVFGAATLRAIERRLAGATTGLLTAREAMGVAIAVAAIATCVLWDGPRHGSEWLLVGMAGATPALLLLVMARVPGGDLPPTLKVVPLVRMLGELAAWYGIIAGVALLAGPPWRIETLSLPGVVHIAWAILIAGLAAIRLAAAPAKLWPRLFVGFALFCAWASFMAGAFAIVADRPFDLPIASLPGPLFALALVVAGAVPVGLLAELSAQGVTLSRDDPRPTLA